MLVDANNGGRVTYKLSAELGYMHQSVFLDAHIDETTEVGDVGYDAGEYHAFFQVVNGFHVLVELEYFDGLTRVTPWFFQFLHDVGQGRETDFVCHVFLNVYLASDFLVLDQVFYRTFHVLGNVFHYRITFRMNGRIVERVLGIGDTKETGTLFECLSTHARYFHQFLAGSEGTVFGTIVHDVLGEGRTQT